MPIELEALNLELALLRELLALPFEATRVMGCLAAQAELALELLLLELLVLKSLLELQRVESARVLRCELGRPAPDALLQLEVERVLLLLELELAMLENSVCRARTGSVERRRCAQRVEHCA